MTNRTNALSGDETTPNDDAIPADAFIFPEDAFIFPDDPLVLDKFRAALIHPDDPLTPREEEAGIVVGMDGSTKREAAGPATVLLDPHQVADLLEAVSVDLRKTDSTAFDATGGRPASKPT